jgi:hypothetical protein
LGQNRQGKPTDYKPGDITRTKKTTAIRDELPKWLNANTYVKKAAAALTERTVIETSRLLHGLLPHPVKGPGFWHQCGASNYTGDTIPFRRQ